MMDKAITKGIRVIKEFGGGNECARAVKEG
jgi:hypothetical protein